MKLMNETGSETVVIGTNTSEKSFGIIANEKMFKILSDKIYSDKIAAPIRELSTNALDAHTDAGIADVPFEVHVPTTSEPTFSIRDFGKGMDAQMIEELYTTYGYSSKSHSDAFIGCLGLGSKSPFAYTDRFDIASVYKGMKYMYQCYLDNGVPKIIKFDEFKTDECSGLRVSFNVNRYDIHSFVARMSTIYSYFDTKPTFTGMQIKPENYWQKNRNFYVGGRNHSILMGAVCYQFDINKIIEIVASKEPDTDFSAYRQYPVMLPAPIGSIDIMVSREGVEYTDKTVIFISKFLKQIIKEEKEAFDVEYGKLNTWFERYKYLNGRVNNPYLFNVRSILSKLNDETTHTLEAGKYVVSCAKKWAYASKVERSEYGHATRSYDITIAGVVSSRGSRGSGDPKVVVVKNNSVRHKNAWTSWAREASNRIVILTTSDSAYQAFIDHGIPDISTIESELKKYETVKTSATTNSYKGYFYNIGSWGKFTRGGMIKDLVKEREDNGVHRRILYVPLKGFVPTEKPTGIYNENWASFVNSYFHSKYKVNVVGIRDTDMKQFANDSRFINVIPLLNSIKRDSDRYKYNYIQKIISNNRQVKGICCGDVISEKFMPKEVKEAYRSIKAVLNNTRFQNRKMNLITSIYSMPDSAFNARRKYDTFLDHVAKYFDKNFTLIKGYSGHVFERLFCETDNLTAEEKNLRDEEFIPYIKTKERMLSKKGC